MWGRRAYYGDDLVELFSGLQKRFGPTAIPPIRPGYDLEAIASSTGNQIDNVAVADNHLFKCSRK